MGIPLNLAAARLRHIAGTAWSTKRYLNIELLKDQQMRPSPLEPIRSA
jgi:putative transposase